MGFANPNSDALVNAERSARKERDKRIEDCVRRIWSGIDCHGQEEFVDAVRDLILELIQEVKSR